MLFLGIDTSASSGAIALADSGKVLSERILDVPRTHVARLLPQIRDMLAEATIDFQEIDAIAVTTGPGSFTGLRIGITTAKTLSLVSEKPLVGVPTLDVLLGNVPHEQGLICPVLDARRGEVYAALFRRDPSGNVERLTEYLCLTLDSLLKKVHGPALFLGEGVKRYSDQLRGTTAHRIVEEPECHQVRASVLCRLAREKFTREGGTHPGELEALYVRASDAEIHRAHMTGQ